MGEWDGLGNKEKTRNIDGSFSEDINGETGAGCHSGLCNNSKGGNLERIVNKMVWEQDCVDDIGALNFVVGSPRSHSPVRVLLENNPSNVIENRHKQVSFQDNTSTVSPEERVCGEVIRKEATEAWELGKLLGLTDDH
ncbi:hypothetical protein GOBAR_DD23699 [Gossypium barbadense]|nr:hypothetical protein GOBAR_DD23699 [Gossypium barbadense]